MPMQNSLCTYLNDKDFLYIPAPVVPSEDNIIIQLPRNEDIPPQLCVLSFPFDTSSGGEQSYIS